MVCHKSTDSEMTTALSLHLWTQSQQNAKHCKLHKSGIYGCAAIWCTEHKPRTSEFWKNVMRSVKSSLLFFLHTDGFGDTDSDCWCGRPSSESHWFWWLLCMVAWPSGNTSPFYKTRCVRWCKHCSHCFRAHYKVASWISGQVKHLPWQP